VVTCRWIALAAAAAALTGCEVYSSPSLSSCPGTKVGTFNFQGNLRPSSCAFAANGTVVSPLPFTGTFSVDADGGACLSIDVPHAKLRLGTHTGNDVVVSYRNVGGTVNPCTCPVDVIETIQGTVYMGDGGVPTGFDGGMTSLVTPTLPDAGPAADGGICGCGLDCALEYDVTAQPAGVP
jgi:hypothetical protein